MFIVFLNYKQIKITNILSFYTYIIKKQYILIKIKSYFHFSKTYRQILPFFILSQINLKFKTMQNVYSIFNRTYKK